MSMHTCKDAYVYVYIGAYIRVCTSMHVYLGV